MTTQDQIGEFVVPPPDVLAFYIRFQRGLMRWKQDALASKAGVSLSTIQRVERGEIIAKASLEKIAVALGQASGAFTEPRIRNSEEETLMLVMESFAWVTETVPVKVAPLRKEPQLREILSSTTALVDSNLGDQAEDDLAVLREWLDFASWMAATSSGFITPRADRSFKKRKLYADIFGHVQMMERKHKAVCLVGTYEATSNVELFKTLTVGVVAFRSKEDPAAITTSELRAPPFVDLRKVLTEWMEGDT